MSPDRPLSQGERDRAYDRPGWQEMLSWEFEKLG